MENDTAFMSYQHGKMMCGKNLFTNSNSNMHLSRGLENDPQAANHPSLMLT